MSEDQLLCKVAALEAQVELLRKEKEEMSATLKETREVLGKVIERLNVDAKASWQNWMR
jgi:hypothetical protein